MVKSMKKDEKRKKKENANLTVPDYHKTKFVSRFLQVYAVQ